MIMTNNGNNDDHNIHTTKSPSSSDTDSGDDEGGKQQEDLKTLESELSDNPSNYDAHVQYVKLLRKVGEIEKLRKAREAMIAVFPLSPSLWLDWVRDETSLSDRPDDYTAVEQLYERAVSDYLFIPLWCSYLKYVRDHDPSVRQFSPQGISKARDLFERALIAAGLHVSQGSSIWEEYLDFEQAVLLAIHDGDVKAKELQVQRIRTIFHRQLSIPLLNASSVLLAYKAWEGKQGSTLDAESSDLGGISSHLATAYQKAVEMCNARAGHEEQISKLDITDSEKFQKFLDYIKFEKSVGDPTRVQVLYERAVTDLPVSSDIWLDYAHYLNKTLKVGNIVRSVHFRAVRNCPWVGELWVQYLLCLERCHTSENEISAVFEKSLQCTFSTLEEYLDLFLTRVDGLRRRMTPGFEMTDALDYSMIRETFQYASDYLSPQLKETDSLLRLYAYWSRLEMTLGKDLVAACGVWERLLKTSGSMLKAWLDYIAMEIELGHIAEARSIYRRCYSKRFPGTGSEDICHSWLRFEREFGTLEDFDLAMQKVAPRLEELQLYRLQQESAAVADLMDRRDVPIKKTTRDKRKMDLNSAFEQSPSKRQKQTALIHKEGENYVEGQNLAELNESKEKKSMIVNTEKLRKEDTDRGRRKEFMDQCTAFISNLGFQATTEDLQNFFSDVGGVASIRILHDKFTGKSRGLAYVDFSDDEYLTAAVAKNRQMLQGKRLSIARSDPKRNKKDAHQGPKQHENSSERSGKSGGFSSKESVESNKEYRASRFRKSEENIQLRGKNTFAIPRNVRPLGWDANKPKPVEVGDEKPKSNEEFRKLFITD